MADRLTKRELQRMARDVNGSSLVMPSRQETKLILREALLLLDERDQARDLLARAVRGDPVVAEATIDTQLTYCIHCSADDEMVCGEITHAPDCVWVASREYLKEAGVEVDHATE